MYYILALLTGVIISAMVSVNGGLTDSFGVFYAAVIIHIVGVVFAFFLCLIRKDRLFQKTAVPRWAYLGGVVGVLTTLFNNYAYARLSMTSIVALGLLGQCLSSNILDAYGLFGMKKRPIDKFTWAGIVVSCIGVLIMLDDTVKSVASAVVFSLGAGVTVVMSRTLNSRLSEEVGALAGSFYNHLIGLPVCVAVAAVMSSSQIVDTQTLRPWMLCGGMLGVLVVMVFNLTVPHISAFRLTLLSFLGQIFSGFAIDLAFGRQTSPRLFWGGVVVAIGLLGGMLLCRYKTMEKD